MNQITAFPWYGGKAQRVSWIRSIIPEDSANLREQHYIEPFFGAGSILLNRPRANIETVSDIHDGIVDFFKMCRDYPEQLERALYFTPYAREELKRCKEPIVGDPLENARRFIVRVRQSLHAHEVVGSWAVLKSDNAAKRWTSFLDSPLIQYIHARMRDVQIEQRDALKVIKSMDSPDAMFYVDPPYVKDLHHSRARDYKHGGGTEADFHFELCALLTNCRGQVAVSGYDGSLYDDLLVGFTKHYDRERVVKGSAGVNTKTKSRTVREVVWTNFDVQQLSLFDMSDNFEDNDTDEDWGWQSW